MTPDIKSRIDALTPDAGLQHVPAKAGQAEEFHTLVRRSDMHAAIEAVLGARSTAAQPVEPTSAVTVLPDGSAFMTGSLPLPKDHWIFAPRCAEWDNVRDTSADTPYPILNNSHRAAVRAAMRYAIRGATMCGKDMDFDPDALALNAAYALCGPAFGVTLPVDAPPAASGDSTPPSAPADGEQLWLWQNGDHFLAFRHLYPCHSPGGDPMTLGEPFGRAIFKHSHNREGKPNEQQRTDRQSPRSGADLDLQRRRATGAGQACSAGAGASIGYGQHQIAPQGGWGAGDDSAGPQPVPDIAGATGVLAAGRNVAQGVAVQGDPSGAPRAEPEAAGQDCHGLDTPERVRFYEHDFYVLSNFSAFRLEWKGSTFDTSEAAYHCEKFAVQSEPWWAIIGAPSAHEAFKIAEKHKAERRADWDDVKVDIMRDILRAKAQQHEYVRRKLLATGDRELVEDSWRDDFWGWGPNRDGKNMLGRLWMEVRAEFREAEPPQAASGSRGD